MREMVDRGRRRAQQAGNVRAITSPSRKVRAKRVCGNRGPNRDGSGVHQLVADRLHLASASPQLIG
ncbi:MAG TPA: hypothetical protein VFU90_16180 [Candidatus Tumulicola sp.]|nr:hypothetical protein [Candidatus Tumulicola sp.]